MSTDAQIRANQANAQLSTGPKTPDGKVASSQNSTKHGAYSQKKLVDGEDPAEFEALRQEYLDACSPSGPIESRLVEDMFESDWKLRRFARMENATYRMYALVLEEEMSALPDDADLKFAYILHQDSIGAKTLKFLAQQQARMNRVYNQSNKELRQRQAATAQETVKQPTSPVALRATDGERSQTVLPSAAEIAPAVSDSTEIKPINSPLPAKAA